MQHIGTQTIETERLILRRFCQSDAQDMLRYWAGDEKIQSMYAEPTYETLEAVEGLLDQYIKGYESKDYYRWAVILKENMACIGQIAYFLLDQTSHYAEIEYCIGSDFQKRGLATEAAKAVIAFGFHKINLHKVQISHKAVNPASEKVIKKCGFHYDGVCRDYFYDHGSYIDRLYYSILENEYQVIEAD